MRESLEFLLWLFNAHDPAHVGREDFDGPHGENLRVFQNAGFIASEPCMNPVPSCPHCLRGTPYPIDVKYFCLECGSEVDRRDLWLWRLDSESFLKWISPALGLDGVPERIDAGLWRMGVFGDSAAVTECFYLRGDQPTERALRRLRAFRSVLIFHGKAEEPDIPGTPARIVSLIEFITVRDGHPRCPPLASFLRHGGRVHFDPDSGAVYAGDVSLGRIDHGTREFHLMALRQNLWVSDEKTKRLLREKIASWDIPRSRWSYHASSEPGVPQDAYPDDPQSRREVQVLCLRRGPT